MGQQDIIWGNKYCLYKTGEAAPVLLQLSNVTRSLFRQKHETEREQNLNAQFEYCTSWSLHIVRNIEKNVLFEKVDVKILSS